MKRIVFFILIALAAGCVRAVDLSPPADAFTPFPDGDGSGSGSGLPDARLDDGGVTPDAAITPPVDAAFN